MKLRKYVKTKLPKEDRSLLAQLRCGVLPLRLETGRFCGLRPAYRIFQFCDSEAVEDEKHFILFFFLKNIELKDRGCILQLMIRTFSLLISIKTNNIY